MKEEDKAQYLEMCARVFVRALRDPHGNEEFELSEGEATDLLIRRERQLPLPSDHAELIGRLEELNRARTQGEWRADEGDGSQHYGKDGGAKIMLWADEDCEHHPVADFSCNHTCRMEFDTEANAAYAAAACNATPVLIAHIRALTASLSRVEGERDELREQLRPGSKTERAPTQDAYDKACAALWRHRNRLDWLAGHVVAVRLPLRWGSREIFTATPDEDGTPSDLVEMIDAAMISDAQRLSRAAGDGSNEGAG